jgi:hypothetical protein
MKTPREILLARHRAVEPKLDTLRREIIAELNKKEINEPRLSNSVVSLFFDCLKNLWLELIWPSRRIWAGLAAVWILILAANLSMRDQSGIKIAKSPSSSQMITAFRQQQQILGELIGSDDPPVAEAQKTFSPRPASERRMELLMT